MRYRGILLFPWWLFAGVVLGQSAVSSPDTGDQRGNWALQPAPSAAVDYRLGPPVTNAVPPETPFQFRDSYPDNLVDHPAPSAMDREAVLGMDRPWADGRPPVDCALTPHDPKC
jgi:hypothetical protein